mmetsp:Transcript_19096/g.59956  ORF Transcript_19096/g.59956 Transcript_19096/m.59956 type:complete len:312 (+) Transcript_19096:611-1546(+)
MRFGGRSSMQRCNTWFAWGDLIASQTWPWNASANPSRSDESATSNAACSTRQPCLDSAAGQAVGVRRSRSARRLAASSPRSCATAWSASLADHLGFTSWLLRGEGQEDSWGEGVCDTSTRRGATACWRQVSAATEREGLALEDDAAELGTRLLSASATGQTARPGCTGADAAGEGLSKAACAASAGICCNPQGPDAAAVAAEDWAHGPDQQGTSCTACSTGCCCCCCSGCCSGGWGFHASACNCTSGACCCSCICICCWCCCCSCNRCCCCCPCCCCCFCRSFFARNLSCLRLRSSSLNWRSRSSSFSRMA